jgi:hypothetical protein
MAKKKSKVKKIEQEEPIEDFLKVAKRPRLTDKEVRSLRYKIEQEFTERTRCQKSKSEDS